MATVGDLLRGLSQNFVILAGAGGLGREVRRIVHVPSSTKMVVPVGDGDLVVYAGANGRSRHTPEVDHALSALLSSGAAGVLTDVEPKPVDVRAADQQGSPLMTSVGGVDTQQLHTLLVQALEINHAVLARQQVYFQRELSDLSRAGATPAMLVERLGELAGKAGVLQRRDGQIDHFVQPVLQALDDALVRHAIESSDSSAQHWLCGSADAIVNNLLYLELAADRLVRLVTPVWVEGQIQAALSLFARPDELAARDRILLLAASRAIGDTYATGPAEVPSSAAHRKYAAVAIRCLEASVDDVAAVARERVAPKGDVALVVGREDVRLCLPYEFSSPYEWRAWLGQWHADLSKGLGGTVSVGHAVRMGAEPNSIRCAVVRAAEAALLGDHLFGPGDVNSYADTQLASFMLGARQVEDLRTLYERVIGKVAQKDLKRERELVATLEVYCDMVATQGTAERLHVHRNTVLYRLKRIEELTSMDLADGPSRSLLQLGLLAGRLARDTDGQRIRADISPAHLRPRRLGPIPLLARARLA